MLLNQRVSGQVFFRGVQVRILTRAQKAAVSGREQQLADERTVDDQHEVAYIDRTCLRRGDRGAPQTSRKEKKRKMKRRNTERRKGRAG